MAENAPTFIPVKGRLDTVLPESASEMGTLRDATDLDHLNWGPRPGRSNVASISSGNDAKPRFYYGMDGVDDYLLFPYLAEQMVWGLSWTIDLEFQFTGLSSSPMGIFCRGNGTTNDVFISLLGSGSAAGDRRKVRAIVNASTSGGAFSTTTTLTGTTQLAQGSVSIAATPTDIYTIKLVRNVGALYLYVNGTLEASDTSTLSTTVGNEYSPSGFEVGRNTSSAANSYYTGWVFKAMCRSGVHTDVTDIYMDSCHASAPVVLFQSGCGPVAFWVESGSAVIEQSRFRNYGTVGGAPSSDSILTWPASFPVQAINSMTDRYGRVWNLVMANGRFYYERAT
jgi:hypothetical protein